MFYSSLGAKYTDTVIKGGKVSLEEKKKLVFHTADKVKLSKISIRYLSAAPHICRPVHAEPHGYFFGK